MENDNRLIIAAARAIYEARNGARCVPWSQRDANHKTPYLKDAHAALKTFRALLPEQFPQ